MRLWVTAMRCSAQLSWRLPPRCRRWRVRLPEEAGIGATPARRASLASDGKARHPGGLGDQLGGCESPAAGQIEQLRAPERAPWRRSRAPAQRRAWCARGSPARDRVRRARGRPARARAEACGRPCRARRSRSRAPAGNSRSGHRSCRCQRRRCWSSERGSDEVLAVVEQELDLKRVLVEVGGGQRFGTFAEGRSGDGQGVDRVGLAGRAFAAAGFAHQLRRARGRRARPRRPGSARRRPRRGGSPRAPRYAAGRARAPQSSKLGVARLAWRAPSTRRRAAPVRANTAAQVWLVLWGSVPITIMWLRPFDLVVAYGRTAGGHASLGAKPRSYQVTPGILGRRRATQRMEVSHLGRQRSLGVSPPPSENQPVWSDANRRP